MLRFHRIQPRLAASFATTTQKPKSSSTSNSLDDSSASSLSNIRNIGIIAHIDAGKTTITERMLYYSGYTSSIGNVDQGSTVTDYLPSEKERGITITSACIPLLWKNCKLNLIDTPGHVDFTVEVERSVRVLDGAVVLVDGSKGVEAQTETVWNQANRYAIPRIVMVNKMDRIGASIRIALDGFKKLKGWGKPIVLQYPIVLSDVIPGAFEKFGNGGSFILGVVDLIEMKALDFATDQNGSVMISSEIDGPESISKFCRNQCSPKLAEDLWQSLKAARLVLLEDLSMLDDAILDSFLENPEIPASIVKPVIRNLTLSGKIVPLFCGSAFKNIAVQPVMNAVVDYLPSPLERPSAVAALPDGTSIQVLPTDQKLCAFAFKIINDEKRGALVFIRIYSGVIRSRVTLYNSTQNIIERAGKLLQMYADDYEEIPEATPGNITCVTGLDVTRTGDTLLLSSEHFGMVKKGAVVKVPETAIVLPSITVAPPVFTRSVEAKSSSDVRKLELALEFLCREDPSIVITNDPDSGQTLMGGMGELHLEIASERLLDVHKCAAKMGPVTISYRNSIELSNDPLEFHHIYNREVFGKKSCMEISLCVSPKPVLNHDTIIPVTPDMNMISIDLNFDSVFPSPLVRKPGNLYSKPQMESPANFPLIYEVKEALRTGLESALGRGPILGFPLINLCVSIKSLKFVSPDLTSVGGIRACAAYALQQAVRTIPTRLLEPILELRVRVPESSVGAVVKDLSGREGQVLSMESDETGYEVVAMVPAGNVVGYSSDLRSLTGGSGSFGMSMVGFGYVPSVRESKIVGEFSY